MSKKLFGILLALIGAGACHGSENDLSSPGRARFTNVSAYTALPALRVPVGTSGAVIGEFALQAEDRPVAAASLEFAFGKEGSDDLWTENYRLQLGDESLVPTLPCRYGSMCFRFKDRAPLASPDAPETFVLKADIAHGVGATARYTLLPGRGIRLYDTEGREISLSLPADPDALKLNYLYAPHGSFSVKPLSMYGSDLKEGKLVASQTKLPYYLPVAAFALRMYGEDVVVPRYKVNLYYGHDLGPDDLSGLKAFNVVDPQDSVAIDVLPPNNPVFNDERTDRVFPANVIGYVIIVGVRLRPGATGTLQACLSDISAYGQTTRTDMSLPGDVCGFVRTVVP